MLRKFRLTGAVVGFVVGAAFAGNRVGMEIFYKQSAPGLQTWVTGKSMLFGQSLRKKSKFSIRKFKKVLKVFLIWSGEVSGGVSGFDRVMLKCPGADFQEVKADRTYTEDSKGLLYSCAADITTLSSGGGAFTLKGLLSDSFKGDDKRKKYSAAGYACIVVYKEPGVSANKQVRVMTGLLKLSPGEMHDMVVLEKADNLSCEKLTVIGAHGRKGNASANLLNGISVSGGEDWDGTAGIYWDVDEFEVTRGLLDERKDGLTLSFDSLLQWIYPSAAVFVFE